MGTSELRKRANWQGSGGAKAEVAEQDFHRAFVDAFAGTDFGVRPKPRDFNDIYSNITLSEHVLARIYTPPGETWTHGVLPDYAIDNHRTNKTLYVEVKRQDGWVEGKARNAGRGNAHERSCKYFTPGLLRILRERGRLGTDVLPFWVVYMGDIARDPKRVREIHCWFAEHADHFFLWTDAADAGPLVNHFESKLQRLLL